VDESFALLYATVKVEVPGLAEPIGATDDVVEVPIVEVPAEVIVIDDDNDTNPPTTGHEVCELSLEAHGPTSF
jgi:hypothetical protein